MPIQSETKSQAASDATVMQGTGGMPELTLRQLEDAVLNQFLQERVLVMAVTPRPREQIALTLQDLVSPMGVAVAVSMILATALGLLI